MHVVDVAAPYTLLYSQGSFMQFSVLCGELGVRDPGDFTITLSPTIATGREGFEPWLTRLDVGLREY
jgi:hypothetical protein